MLIYLLRHGDAVQSSAYHDSERPLSSLGEHQSIGVGTFLRRSNILIPSIFSSPLRRAVQTAEIICRHAGPSKLGQSEYLVPGSRHQQIFDVLDSLDQPSVLLVGHEPHLSQTVALLTADQSDLGIEFGNCTLACIECDTPLRKGQGMLKWLVTADQADILRNQAEKLIP
jgi:phosphohistidine phosphatase